MALEIVPPRKSALKAPRARKSSVADANIDVTRTATVEASASNGGSKRCQKWQVVRVLRLGGNGFVWTLDPAWILCAFEV